MTENSGNQVVALYNEALSYDIKNEDALNGLANAHLQSGISQLKTKYMHTLDHFVSDL